MDNPSCTKHQNLLRLHKNLTHSEEKQSRAEALEHEQVVWHLRGVGREAGEESGCPAPSDRPLH